VNLSIETIYGEPFFFQVLSYYMLNNLLSEYGPPSTVLIAPFPDDPQYPNEENIPFSIVLFYPEKGILAQYIMPKEKDNGNLTGCPSKVGYVDVVVWNPETNPPLKKIVSMLSGPGINKLNVDYFKPVDEVTSMTMEEFYQTFEDPESTACLETAKEIWP
jgi:hypothetical protein